MKTAYILPQFIARVFRFYTALLFSDADTRDISACTMQVRVESFGGIWTPIRDHAVPSTRVFGSANVVIIK